MNFKRALISTWDKRGVKELAQWLHKNGCEIISSGGTARYLIENEIPVIRVSEWTNSPEILGGRVKTIHPKIMGGILADPTNKKHVQDLQDNQIELIDIVVVNLYPFYRVEQEKLSTEQAIELIDIGGVTLIRSAAKNYHHVTVLSNPNQYNNFINGHEDRLSLFYRKQLAEKAFFETMRYDQQIHQWFSPE